MIAGGGGPRRERVQVWKDGRVGDGRRFGDRSVSISYAGVVLFYGVVSAQTEKVVEFFLDG